MFKFELIELKVEKNANGRYVGKGRGKLGIAEVNIEASKSYGSGFSVSMNDGQKTIAISDLRKLGFTIDVQVIEDEYNRQVKFLEIEANKQKQVQPKWSGLFSEEIKIEARRRLKPIAEKLGVSI